jgi:hypothetical protein
VQEANAAHAPENDDESDADGRSEDRGEDSGEEGAASPDAEMTERFRSFAETRRST